MAEKIVKVTTVHEVSMWHSDAHGCVVAFEANGDRWPESDWTPAMHAAAKELRSEQRMPSTPADCEWVAVPGGMQVRKRPESTGLRLIKGAHPAPLRQWVDDNGVGWDITELDDDECKGEDGVPRKMLPNEVRDVVTGRGLKMVHREATARDGRAVPYIEFRDHDGRGGVTWPIGADIVGHNVELALSEERIDQFHPCFLPSNRLRVEAFLAANKDLAARTGVAPQAAAAVLPEAHSGSPSGEPYAGWVFQRKRCGHVSATPQKVCPECGDDDGTTVPLRTCNGTGRKTEESDVPNAVLQSGDVGRTEPGSEAAAVETADARVAVPSERPLVVPAHIPDADWTVIEGRAVWREGGALRIEDRTGATFSGWLSCQRDTYESCRGMQCDVPQSLFLAARRWMGWDSPGPKPLPAWDQSDGVPDDGSSPEPESLEVIMLRVELDIANDSASRWEQVARDLAERIKSGGAL